MAQIKYCTTTNAYAHNKGRTYNTTSSVTSSMVTSWITFVSGEIDARLYMCGVTVPITTSPATYQSYYLKQACSYKVAALAENSPFFGGNKQESSHAAWLLSQYELMMKRIEDRPTLFSGNNGAVIDSYELSNSDEIRDNEPFERSTDNLGTKEW